MGGGQRDNAATVVFVAGVDAKAAPETGMRGGGAERKTDGNMRAKNQYHIIKGEMGLRERQKELRKKALKCILM